MPASASAPHTLPFNYCHVEREIITMLQNYLAPRHRERRKLAVNYLEAMLRRIYRMCAEVESLFKSLFVGDRLWVKRRGQSLIFTPLMRSAVYDLKLIRMPLKL